MASGIPINLVVEDELGEQMLRALLAQSGRDFQIGVVRGKQGGGYLKKHLTAFNNAAKGMAYFIFTDLDDKPCASVLIEDWFNCSVVDYPKYRTPNLFFRIAVREVESWVMADREAFAAFLGISISRIPLQTDVIPRPKEFLLGLAKDSRKRSLREDLIPKPGDYRKTGPDYNGRLAGFLQSGSWRAAVAESHSLSLARTRKRLSQFHPVFPTHKFRS
jgi:hypothetical protein